MDGSITWNALYQSIRKSIVGISRRNKFLLAGLILVSAWIFWDINQVNKAFKDIYKDDNFLKMTPDQHRELAHRVLRYPVGNHHDAFLELEMFGNRDSVPKLISALKWHDPLSSSNIMVCTKIHCLEALREITGENNGTSYFKWRSWWRSTGSKLPDSEFRKPVSLSSFRKSAISRWASGAVEE